jgi:hypothetical protein
VARKRRAVVLPSPAWFTLYPEDYWLTYSCYLPDEIARTWHCYRDGAQWFHDGYWLNGEGVFELSTSRMLLDEASVESHYVDPHWRTAPTLEALRTPRAGR